MLEKQAENPQKNDKNARGSYIKMEQTYNATEGKLLVEKLVCYAKTFLSLGELDEVCDKLFPENK